MFVQRMLQNKWQLYTDLQTNESTYFTTQIIHLHVETQCSLRALYKLASVSRHRNIGLIIVGQKNKKSIQ